MLFPHDPEWVVDRILLADHRNAQCLVQWYGWDNWRTWVSYETLSRRLHKDQLLQIPPDSNVHHAFIVDWPDSPLYSPTAPLACEKPDSTEEEKVDETPSRSTSLTPELKYFPLSFRTPPKCLPPADSKESHFARSSVLLPIRPSESLSLDRAQTPARPSSQVISPVRRHVDVKALKQTPVKFVEKSPQSFVPVGRSEATQVITCSNSTNSSTADPVYSSGAKRLAEERSPMTPPSKIRKLGNPYFNSPQGNQFLRREIINSHSTTSPRTTQLYGNDIYKTLSTSSQGNQFSGRANVRHHSAKRKLEFDFDTQ
eukprot:TRINITY_DN7987_c0_g1_i3.p1 TRINITY_DN7987_c0_g1~~TRINITY_DN7987_c0_g1_i3.p1  ORF type:complete len:313 (-),score=21.97 TRINITY_DN7987_c0_g1_i3:25-963(-)